RQLGIPEGTLSGRLTTARRLLAKRLAQRGLALSAGALAALLAPNAASACLPAPLVISTVKIAALLASEKTLASVASASVAAITKGVTKAMLLSKLKVTAVFLVVVGMAAAGSGAFVHRSQAGAEAVQIVTASDRPATPAVARDPEVQKILDKYRSF